MENEIRSLELEKELLHVEMNILSNLEEEDRALLPEKQAQLASTEESLRGSFGAKKAK